MLAWSRRCPRLSTPPCTIVGRGSAYAAIIRPNARHVLCRPPRRCSPECHARVAAEYTTSRHGLLHRMPEDWQEPRRCAHSTAYCAWRGRWRWSRHHRQSSPRMRRSRFPSGLRVLGSPPRQVVPQEWTTPRKLHGPGLRPAAERCGRPQSPTVGLSVGLSSPYWAKRFGSTSCLRRASSATSQPMPQSSAKRHRTTWPRQWARPTVAPHVSRPSCT
jgi:hypothetical protein